LTRSKVKLMRKKLKRQKSTQKASVPLAFPLELAENQVITELRQNVQKLKIFDSLGKAITSSLDLPEIFESLATQMSRLVDCAHIAVGMIDSKTESFSFAYPERLVDPINFLPLGRGLIGATLERGRGGLFLEPSDEPLFDPEIDGRLLPNPTSLMTFPIMARGSVMGVLVFATAQNEPRLTEESYRTIETFTDYLSIAVENARNYQRLKELSLTDDLTQLYNSRYLHLVLDRELSRSQRHHFEFSLIFIDLDNFKRINDENGHMAGSGLLKEFGDFLLKKIRVSDVGIRYGGDEFVLVLPQTSQENAFLFTSRLREQLSEHQFLKDRGLKVKLTASFGISTYPADGQSIDELIAAADKAMYHVKRGNKNGVFACSRGHSLLSTFGSSGTSRN
jgi:diguanylate cyclase (GGDEF)-like protein